MLPNTPAMLECHYGVPMCGAVLNTLNTRLDAAIIAFSLDHGEAKVLKEAYTRILCRIEIDDAEIVGIEMRDEHRLLSA